MAGAEEKLLGRLTLQYGDVEKAVASVNKLLASIGKGVDFDLTDIVRKELKSSQDELVKEVKSSSTQSAQQMKKLGQTINTTTTSVDGLVKSFTALGKDNSLKQTMTYIDNLGRTYTETFKDGILTGVSVADVGELKKTRDQFQQISKDYEKLIRLKTELAKATPGSQKEAELKNQVAHQESLVAANEKYIASLKKTNEVERQIAQYREKQHELQAKYAKDTASNTTRNYEQEALKAIKEQIKLTEKLAQVKKQIDKAEDASSTDRLTRAQSVYTAQLNAQQQVLQAQLAERPELNQNANIQKELANLALKRAQAENKVGKSIDDNNEKLKQHNTMLSSITDTLTRMMTLWASQALTKFWQDGISYAQQYYDKMNEIRIVTGASESESLKLGESYRRIASEMKVSSTEVATAAVEFWRQGVGNDKVTALTQDTVMYAKVAGQAFEEAAQLVTAAVNSMELDSQRVVDVFTYLGDASASGADEIGMAMQKASASAQEAGLSFEWLGAYIATISEKTRQAPEVIGTAFNSIMARLQSIKQKGFNEEDETKINDVAKALNTIDVALMDQRGNWRNMSDILLDIAAKWETLDDKSRAYLATTIAGTRQKNVFLTLMEDMSKITSSTGEASRAMELYEGALSAVGSAGEKFSVWQESITASQDNLKNSLEGLYSLLDAEWIKGFYDGLAQVVDKFTLATAAMGGMNLVIPATIAGVVGLVSIIQSLVAVAGGATVTLSGLWAVVQAHPIGAVLTIFAGLTAAMTMFGSGSKQAGVDVETGLSKVKKSLDEISMSQTRLDATSREIETLRLRYIELTTQTSLTKTQQDELDRILQSIAEISPTLASAVEGLGNKYKYSAEMVALLNEELKNQQTLEGANARNAARSTYETLAQTGNALASTENKENISKASSLNAIANEFVAVRETMEAEGKSAEEAAETWAENVWDALADQRERITQGKDYKKLEDIEARKREVKETYNTQFATMNAGYADMINDPDYFFKPLDEQYADEAEYQEKIKSYEKIRDATLAALEAEKEALDLSVSEEERRAYEERMSLQEEYSGVEDIYFSDRDYYVGELAAAAKSRTEEIRDAYTQIIAETTSQEKNWRDSTERVMETFLTDSEAQKLGGAYREYVLNTIKNGVAALRPGDLEAGDFTVLEQTIYAAIGKASKAQATELLDPKRKDLNDQIQVAWDVWSSDGTMESLTAYNELVNQWNEASEFKIDPLDPTLAKSVEELGKAAEETGSQLGETTSKADEYIRMISQRNEMKEAQKSGYSQQLAQLEEAAIKEIDGTRVFDEEAYVKKYNELFKQNEALIKAMFEEEKLSDLVELASGAFEGDEEGAIKAFEAASEHSQKLAEYWQNYYSEVEQAVSPASQGGVEFDQILQGLYNAVQNSEESLGVAAFFEQLAQYEGVLTEDGGLFLEQLQEMYPWMQDLTETMYTQEELLSLIEEAMKGTAENLVSFVGETEDIGTFGTNEGIEFLERLKDVAGDPKEFDDFKSSWNDMSDDMKKSIKKVVDEGDKWFDDWIDGTMDIEDGMKEVDKALRKLKIDKLEDAGKIYKEVGEIVSDLEDHVQNSGDAYGEMIEKLNQAALAQSDLNTILSASDHSSQEYTDACESLSSTLGYTVTAEQNTGIAIMNVASMMDVASNSAAQLLNFLAGISGSTFNSGSWQAELSALAASGNACAAVMSDLISEITSLHGARVSVNNGLFSVEGLTGGKRSSSSTQRNSSGGASGGGGGGGGSSNSNDMSEIEKMLDLMKRIQDLKDHQMDVLDEARSYYEETGLLQGVIMYHKKERDAILENNKILDENIEKIEKQLETQKKKVAGMSASDKNYDKEREDLEALQEAHQEYSLALLENKTRVEALKKEIEDVYDEIRDMEIELRDAIYEAIEDRESLNERMLDGEINVQDEILSALKERYEKERELAIETAEAKQKSLEAEIDLQDEQLEKRKKLAEEEDKAKELAELETKLARISADPTRKKEELELREKIADLRDEIAWDLAEDEVEAQKNSIEQQIDSLDEYIDYVESYYEDLFEHPEKLIAEMEEIMKMTDEEIIRWLQENNSEYQASTEAMQQDMVNGWNEMLMDMHGSITTYWDEVEQIIQQGDKAIIEFLKNNSQDYKEAGKLQAEAYVEEWLEQLDALKKAYKQVQDEVDSYEYEIIQPAPGSSTGGSGGSSKKPSNGGDSQKPSSSTGTSSTVPAKNPSGYGGSGANPIRPNYSAYATGGLAQETGFAWLDGTKEKPERVLSPHQTKLFEDMISTLHAIKIKTTPTPTIPYESINSTSLVTVEGGINIVVERLSEDADYEDLATKVLESIENMTSRTSAVGGIRMR